VTAFCILLICTASVFIFITVQIYQQTLVGLQERIDVLEQREEDLRVSLELEKTRYDEFESMLSDLQEEAQNLITESDSCTNRLQTARQREQELELQNQKAQFKRDQIRLSRLSN